MNTEPQYPSRLHSDADELDAAAKKMMPVEFVHSMPEAIHRLIASAMVRAAASILRETP